MIMMLLIIILIMIMKMIMIHDTNDETETNKNDSNINPATHRIQLCIVKQGNLERDAVQKEKRVRGNHAYLRYFSENHLELPQGTHETLCAACFCLKRIFNASRRGNIHIITYIP